MQINFAPCIASWHTRRASLSLNCLPSLSRNALPPASMAADGLSSSSNQHHRCNGGFRKLLARKEKEKVEREREAEWNIKRAERKGKGERGPQSAMAAIATLGVASRDKRRRSPLLSLPLLLPDIREKEEEREGKGNLCIRKGLRCPTNQHSSGRIDKSIIGIGIASA